MDAINELRTAETAREQKLAQEKEEKRVLQILEKAKLVGLVNAFGMFLSPLCLYTFLQRLLTINPTMLGC